MTTSVSDEIIFAASTLSSASLHEASGKTSAFPAVLKPLDRQMRLCGRALPVRSPGGDNLWIHRALAVAAPRDVLVVDTGMGVEFGYWGEIMATSAKALGLAGLVITGGVRDSLALIKLGLPTFSACVSIKGTLKDNKGDGSVGEPIRIGEIVVRKGDLIFGDADGLVALSPETAPGAVATARQRDTEELIILENVRSGALTLDVYKF